MRQPHMPLEPRALRDQSPAPHRRCWLRPAWSATQLAPSGGPALVQECRQGGPASSPGPEQRLADGTTSPSLGSSPTKGQTLDLTILGS